MIYKKHWIQENWLGSPVHEYVGWYLLGVIPIYVKKAWLRNPRWKSR